MNAALRIWILIVSIGVFLYYLYIKRVSEGFDTSFGYAANNPYKYDIGFLNGVAMYIGGYTHDGKPKYAGPVYLPRPDATVVYFDSSSKYIYSWPDIPGGQRIFRYGISYPLTPFYNADNDIYKGIGPVNGGSNNNIETDVSGTRALACSELKDLRTSYINKLAEVRVTMNDLSGTEVLAYNLKTENMGFQYKFSDTCTDLVNRDSLTRREDIARDACIDLASEDDAIYNTVLTNYDATNLNLYEQEAHIQDSLQTINDTIALTKCDVSGFTFSADDDIGTINTEELRAKLDELSPYYISPGTLDFVTTYLVGNGILDTALFTSSEILSSVNSSLSYIKTVADSTMFK